jgi:hypothetical protein
VDALAQDHGSSRASWLGAQLASVRPDGAPALAGHLVPAGSLFASLAAPGPRSSRCGQHRPVLPAGGGRPSLPVTQMAAALTLQALHETLRAQALPAICLTSLAA